VATKSGNWFLWNRFLSFLLAHCGGGQDKAGVPWPLSEAPRHLFSRPVANPRTRKLEFSLLVVVSLWVCASLAARCKERSGSEDSWIVVVMVAEFEPELVTVV